MISYSLHISYGITFQKVLMLLVMQEGLPLVQQIPKNADHTTTSATGYRGLGMQGWAHDQYRPSVSDLKQKQTV